MEIIVGQALVNAIIHVYYL